MESFKSARISSKSEERSIDIAAAFDNLSKVSALAELGHIGLVQSRTLGHVK